MSRNQVNNGEVSRMSHGLIIESKEERNRCAYGGGVRVM